MSLELPQNPLEASPAPRHTAMRSPPDEPLERLVDTHCAHLQAEVVPVPGLARRRLVLLEVGDPRRLLLLGAPSAGAEAREIEGPRTERRGFPVDHGDPAAGSATAENHGRSLHIASGDSMR